MSISFRKSIKVGNNFRINLSQAGVGYSLEVLGGRITRTASGKINVSYNGDKNVNKPNSSKGDDTDTMTDIESAEMKNFQSIEYREITDNITRLLWLDILSNVMILCTVLVFVKLYFVGFLAVGLLLKFLIKTVFSVRLDYELDSNFSTEHDKRINVLEKLSNSDKIWQILSEEKLDNLKGHANVDRNFERMVIKIKFSAPYYLSTNVKVARVRLKNETLILLPDKLLIIRGVRVGAIGNSSLVVETGEIEYTEAKKTARDAKIVDYRWKYANKDGQPDKRYKNNQKIAIYLYKVMSIASTEGLNIKLMSSNSNNL